MKFSLKPLLKGLITLYQLCISPLLGKNCRFYPSCSCYAKEAIELHGSGMGLFLTLKRLFKCHPWYPGGFDPVPPKDLNQGSRSCSPGRKKSESS